MTLTRLGIFVLFGFRVLFLSWSFLQPLLSLCNPCNRYNKLKTESKGKKKKSARRSERARRRKLIGRGDGKKKLAKEKFFLKIFFYLLKEKTRGDK